MDSKKLFTTAIAAAVAATAVVPATFAATTTELGTLKTSVEEAFKDGLIVDVAKVTDAASVLKVIQENATLKEDATIKALTASAITIANGKATINLGKGTEEGATEVTATVTIKAEPASAAKLLLDGKTVIATQETLDFYNEAPKTATEGTELTAEETAFNKKITDAKASVIAAVKALDTAADADKNSVIKGLEAGGKVVVDAEKATITVETKAEGSDPQTEPAVTATVKVAIATIVNNGTSADTITVKGLTDNDIVRVYTGATETKAIGTAKVASGSAKISVKALEEAKPLYISVTPSATGSKEGVKFGPINVSAVAPTERTFSPTVTNKAGVKKDVVTVLGVKAKDVVTVYGSKVDPADASNRVVDTATVLGTAKVSKAGAVDVKIRDGFKDELTKNGKTTIFVSVKEFDKAEGTPVAADLNPEQKSDANAIEVEATNLAGAKKDTITLNNVKAKDIINIYSKATVVAEKTDENGNVTTPASTTVAAGDLVQTIKVAKDAAVLTVKVKGKTGFPEKAAEAKDGSLVNDTWYYTRTALDELASEPELFDVYAESFTEDDYQEVTFTNNVKNRDTITVTGGEYGLNLKDTVKVYEGAVDATTDKKTLKPVASVAAKQQGPLLVTLKTKQQPEVGTVFTYSITSTDQRESFGLSTVVTRTAQSKAVDATKTLLNDNGEKSATLTVIDTLPKAVYKVYEGATEIGKGTAKGGILNITLKDKKYADLKNVTVTVAEVDRAESQQTVVRNLDGKSVTTLAGLTELLKAAKVPVVDANKTIAFTEEGADGNELNTIALLNGLVGITPAYADNKVTLTSNIELTNDLPTTTAAFEVGTEDVSEIAALELVTTEGPFYGDTKGAIVTALKALDSKNKVLGALTEASIVSISEGTKRAKVKVGTKEVIVSVPDYVTLPPAPVDPNPGS